MTPERHARIKEVFLAACDVTEPDRPALIERMCGADGDLRHEVERLLLNLSQHAPLTSAARRADAGTAIPIGRRSAALYDLDAQEDREEQTRKFHPGSIIADRYRIICLLGRGGMGEVYRAEDLSLGKQVALKFLPRLLAQQPAWIEKMRQEVRLAHKVTHPHVCRVYDLGCVDGDSFITMEYIDGENLHSLLRRIGRLPYEKALELAGEICAGLAAAHSKGILHRDLKPANIMIDGRGHARISDFGLAAIRDQVRPAEIRAGTPDYMAPEQLAGREVSVRSDLYALGLTLYEMFTGESALRARTAGESAATPIEHEQAPLPGLIGQLDPELERVILRCLAPVPQQRPDSVAQVAAALPGGSPFEAAIAAGRTLTPEMLAAATDSTPVRSPLRRYGLPAFFVLLLAMVLLSPFVHPIQKNGVDTSPQALAERARQIVSRLNLPRTSYEAFGLKSLVEQTSILSAPTPSHVLATRSAERNPPVFWYRAASRPLTPSEPVRLVFGNARVSASDPQLTADEGYRLVLDASGRLLSLDVHPGPQSTGDPSVDESDGVWTDLLGIAGLDPARLSSVQPQLDIEMPFDHRKAWSARDPITSRLLRVEAASLRGQPVFLALVETDSWLTEVRAGSFSWRRDLVWWSEALLISALAIISIPLARKNLRRGRSDPQGAMRLGVFVFAIRALSWVLQASHAPSLSQEWLMAVLMIAGAMGEAGLLWLLYLALEPYLRRFWPETLIVWVRVLQGRVRDELVGRDVFLGCILGVFIAIMFRLDTALTTLLTSDVRPAVRPVDFYVAMDGVRTTLAFWCDALPQALYYSFAFLLLNLLLRTVLKNGTAANICSVALLSPLFVPRGAHPLFSLVLVGAGCVAVTVWATNRLGLLPVAAGLWLAVILSRVPLTLNARSWYSDLSLLTLLVAIGVTLSSFQLWRRLPAGPAGEIPARQIAN